GRAVRDTRKHGPTRKRPLAPPPAPYVMLLRSIPVSIKHERDTPAKAIARDGPPGADRQRAAIGRARSGHRRAAPHRRDDRLQSRLRIGRATRSKSRGCDSAQSRTIAAADANRYSEKN